MWTCRCRHGPKGAAWPPRLSEVAASPRPVSTCGASLWLSFGSARCPHTARCASGRRVVGKAVCGPEQLGPVGPVLEAAAWPQQAWPPARQVLARQLPVPEFVGRTSALQMGPSAASPPSSPHRADACGAHPRGNRCVSADSRPNSRWGRGHRRRRQVAVERCRSSLDRPPCLSSHC